MRSLLLTLFLVIFIDLLGFGIVIPILPYFAKKFGAGGIELGLLMMVYSLMQFLMAPVWGLLSDRYGRKPILLMSIAGSMGSMILMGFAESLTMLFVGRILAGFFGANISTAYAYVADITDESNRAKGMGIIGAAFGLGFIFGPAFGGILAGPEGHYYIPMFAGAALAGFNLILAFFTLKEPPLDQSARAANRSRKLNWDAIQLVTQKTMVSTVIWMFFLLTLAVTQLEVVFALYMNKLFNLEAREAGFALALSGFFMVLMQGGLVGRLAKKYGESKLVTAGGVIAFIGLLAFALSPSLELAIVFLCFLSIGHGMLHPSLSSLTSQYADPTRRGFVMGVFHSGSSLARIIGPLIAGLLYDETVLQAPFYFGSILLIFLVALNVYSKKLIAKGEK